MGKRLDLTGQRFGRLVVLGFSHTNRHRAAMWQCQCKCGNSIIVNGENLRQDHTKSCGHCNQIKIGNKYGRWTILKYIRQNKNGQSMWRCKCDCGTIRIIIGASLKSGNSKSCGCYNREQLRKVNSLPKGEASFNTLFRQYERNAKKKKYPFQLTKKQFKHITTQKCHYCGTIPIQIYIGLRYNGGYKYNGIDRVNNSKGYTKSNSVSCCTQCNMMKKIQSKKEFLAHVERIHKHQHNSK